jgi:hypothetical protein
MIEYHGKFVHMPCTIRHCFCNSLNIRFEKRCYMNSSTKPVATLLVVFVLLLVTIYGVAAIIS